MDESKLGNEIDDTVFAGDLHGDGEIVEGFRGEEYVDGLFGKRLVGWLMADLDNVELPLATACKGLLTLAPVPVLTAKANSFVGVDEPSSLIEAKVAA